jgi:hypothetical protein
MKEQKVFQFNNEEYLLFGDEVITDEVAMKIYSKLELEVE